MFVPPFQIQLALDLSAVMVAGASGALVAVRRSLDLFGALVLAVVTGLGGGVLRDVLIDDVPPAALVDPRYLLAAVFAGLVGFWAHGPLNRLGRTVLLADAAALALFTVAGTTKALTFGLAPFAAALLGMLTGIGGGVLRDVLAGQVPIVFQRELYAFPSLAGATALVVAVRLGWTGTGPVVMAATLIFAFRLIAVKRNWHAPRPRARVQPRIDDHFGDAPPGV